MFTKRCIGRFPLGCGEFAAWCAVADRPGDCLLLRLAPLDNHWLHACRVGNSLRSGCFPSCWRPSRSFHSGITRAAARRAGRDTWCQHTARISAILSGMPSLAPDQAAHAPRTVRLKTLIALRWFAVIGQAVTVLVVHYWLEFELPLAACLGFIALSAWLNVAMSMHFRNVQRLAPRPVAWLLAYDIAQLTALMILTGGLENPFAFFILAPVSVAAISLPLRYTLPLGVFALTTSTLIAYFYWPLPWSSAQPMEFPSLYIFATWVANLVAIVFIGAYAWQVAEEGRLMADALTATELVLAREQHLTQLDGLAAAAAHELGTPLSTIAVVAKELEHALGPDSPHIADVRLLREQAQRCREILGKLSALPSEWAPFERVKLSALIEEVVAPHRNFGVAIDLVLPQDHAGEPLVARSPAVLYGLGNLVENAVDFATERVEIAVR